VLARIFWVRIVWAFLSTPILTIMASAPRFVVTVRSLIMLRWSSSLSLSAQKRLKPLTAGGILLFLFLALVDGGVLLVLLLRRTGRSRLTVA
jgi:hypothetical protein